MPTLLSKSLPPFRLALALFALYAVVTIPSLLPRWGASPEGFALLAAWLATAALARPIADGRVPARGAWVAIAAAAIVLRAAALAVMDAHAPVGDPKIYPMLARQLLDGSGLVFADPMTQTTFLTLYPPGYPLLLAGWGALFGTGLHAIWATNVALDLVSAALLGLLGARLGQASAGRAAAWLFATWPTFALAAPFAQKEPLEIALMLAIMLVLLRARDRQTGWRDGLLLGGAAGALALTQPGLAMFPAVLTLALLPAAGLRRLTPLALRGAVVAVAVMLPWWVRNALVLGHFVPLTTTGGLGLWIGNNPHASGNWMPMPDSYRGLPEIEMSARAAHEATAWIVGHPLDFVRLSLTKIARTMGVEQFTLLRVDLATAEGNARTTAMLFPLLQGALWTMLAGTALAAGRVRRVPGGELVLWLAMVVLAQLLLFDLWFEFAERHRYVLMPMLFLIAGTALATGILPARRRAAVPASA